MIIIPDIHGRTFWKSAVVGHEDEKIVFLGDYTDPYPREGIDVGEGMRALREVLVFKAQHDSNVVLLLGNHDLSYVSSLHPKCRHDDENHDAIKSLIVENLHLFSLVHEEWVSNRRVVFSHAGILPAWLTENEMTFGTMERGEEVPRLNEMFNQGRIYGALADVSCYRGGRAPVGSCVWADLEEYIETSPDYLPGCFQVFGHSQRSHPTITDRFACLDCRKAFQLDDNFDFLMIEDSVK